MSGPRAFRLVVTTMVVVVVALFFAAIIIATWSGGRGGRSSAEPLGTWSTWSVVDVVGARRSHVVEACLMPYVRVHMQVPQRSVAGLHVDVYVHLPYLLACMQICFHRDLCCMLCPIRIGVGLPCGCGPEYERHTVAPLSPRWVGEVEEDADDEVACMRL